MVFVLSFIGSKTLLIMLCSDQNEIRYHKSYMLYQICSIYAKMIRLCQDKTKFSMMDKQLILIQKYCTESVLRFL